MAFDEYLVERVRNNLKERNVIFYERKMMGGLIFMVDDKMCIGVDTDKKTGQPRLMGRIGKEAYQDALDEKGVSEMDFTGIVMRGFVFIGPDDFDLDEDLEFWIEKALGFNPLAKKSAKRKPKSG